MQGNMEDITHRQTVPWLRGHPPRAARAARSRETRCSGTLLRQKVRKFGWPRLIREDNSGFPFGGSLPLFPACTHADCSENYEMEESSGEAGRAPNRRSRPAPDASPSPKPRTKPKTICRRALFPAGSKLPSTSIQATWPCSLNLPLLTRLTISWCAVPELN